jgi:hypothetical protein
MYKVTLFIEKNPTVCPDFKFNTIEEALSFAKICIHQHYEVIITNNTITLGEEK